MVVLPYDRYQRLISNASKLEKNDEHHHSTEPVDVQTIRPLLKRETKDRGSQTKVSKKRSEQGGGGEALPPPPGTPIKRLKWLKL